MKSRSKVAKKILIVEDDSTTRRVICKCIEGMGLCAIQSSNGRRAWDVLLDNPDIALVITDMAMPDMNGKALITAMRAEEALAAIPIMVVSGVVGPNEIASVLELGASRFLSKPIEIALLKQYVELLISG